MNHHIRLSLELTGAIAKELPHAKNQLSGPDSFFTQFITEIYIWVNPFGIDQWSYTHLSYFYEIFTKEYLYCLCKETRNISIRFTLVFEIQPHWDFVHFFDGPYLKILITLRLVD